VTPSRSPLDRVCNARSSTQWIACSDVVRSGSSRMGHLTLPSSPAQTLPRPAHTLCALTPTKLKSSSAEDCYQAKCVRAIKDALHQHFQRTLKAPL
jgi:hypothetical protein